MICCDLSDAHRRYERFVSEFLAAVDVRQVDLDSRDLRATDGISQGNTGVGIGGRVDDKVVVVRSDFMNPFDELAFGIGLSKTDFNVAIGSTLTNQSRDISEGAGAVDLGLPSAKEIQVRAV